MTDNSAFDSSFFYARTQQGVTVVRLRSPQLTEEENLEQLDRELNSLLEAFGVRQLVVDMESVGYITSSAIGKFISLHRRLARLEGKLVLCSLSSEVQHILDSSHLLNYFQVADTSSAAVAEFSST